ncbi:ADP-ribosylglycohydrolase [Planomonospora sphaerica]|uniref:ADP-ribosylglycohydrolase n=1 Tax=Planomonospora sphaerica TaxID=161355 RepID=A0A171DHG1_9ACTN|nr:ADP-ribosylglycohydrolase family protein [Planomonospora sphaerica]GAT68501.1 ADP-ribosylglycohydrolase [Planomonospora sphaerica]
MPLDIERLKYASRVRGCLLGGALGNALGWPLSSTTLNEIRRQYGPSGVQGLVPDRDGCIGRISDDTQLTLFTAEALIGAHARMTQKKGGEDSSRITMTEMGSILSARVRDAYLRWQCTQTHVSPSEIVPAENPLEDAFRRTGHLINQSWLYAVRSPGQSTLTGLTHRFEPSPERPDGTPGPVNPESKGCMSTVRSSPFGLVRDDPELAFNMAASCARITHGHPTGYFSAGAFAFIIGRLVEGSSLKGATQEVLRVLTTVRNKEEVSRALQKALSLAEEGAPTPESVEKLGRGWVAEEALAIAVYCALTRQDMSPSEDWPKKQLSPLQKSLLLSVNHSGDSDSTGSMCGSLLGAAHGDTALPGDWVHQLEGRREIIEIADDLSLQVSEPFRMSYNDEWLTKYSVTRPE